MRAVSAALQIMVGVLGALILFVDGFNAQVIGYVAPQIARDWNDSARCAGLDPGRRQVRAADRLSVRGAAVGLFRPQAGRDRLHRRCSARWRFSRQWPTTVELFVSAALDRASGSAARFLRAPSRSSANIFPKAAFDLHHLHLLPACRSASSPGEVTNVGAAALRLAGGPSGSAAVHRSRDGGDSGGPACRIRSNIW